MMVENIYDRGFEDLLQHFDLEYLKQYKGTVMGLWPNLRIAFLNPSWFDFAQANGGEPSISSRWTLGTPVLDAISDSLKPFFETLLQRSLSCARQAASVPQHCYECSSAEVYRCFSMHMYPLDGQGLLIMHVPIVQYCHTKGERPSFHAIQEQYLQGDQTIHQCSYCRRVQHSTESQRWDWVPQWVEHAPHEACHIVCETCLDHYFPNPKQEPVLQGV